VHSAAGEKTGREGLLMGAAVPLAHSTRLAMPPLLAAGKIPKPARSAWATKACCFMDEMPEFDRSVPGRAAVSHWRMAYVTVARVQASLTFPRRRFLWAR